MSIDDIELSPVVLQGLFKQTLIGIDSTTETAAKKTALNFLGNNKKHIVIISGNDDALYLPDEWADASERRREAGVPEDIRFATKPELARQMLERALEAGVPCAWVTGDSIYGGDRKLRR